MTSLCLSDISEFLFKKNVVNSDVTNFKQVPVTEQSKWNGNTGRLDRNTSDLQISLFLLPLSLLLSWNVLPTESVMFAEWKVSGTPKQIPSNSLQSLNERQLQPLFLGGVSHKGKEAFGDGLECVSHSKSKFWHWTNDMFLDAVPAGSFWLQSFFFPGIKAFLVEF